jgi:hypothetical protein
MVQVPEIESYIRKLNMHLYTLVQLVEFIT